MDDERRRVTLVISGKVQGVFFRASALEEAQRLGLSGWVRNLPDGGVESVAEGAEGAVADFVLWCHRGPVAAEVEQVRVRDGAPTGEFRTFTVR